MIPTRLQDWTLDAIRELLTKGLFETDTFEMKEKFTEERDPKDRPKDRAITALAAFANTNGGFLVFGVSDRRDLDVEARLVGFESTVQFPEQFGALAQKVTPLPHWTFLNPALALPNGRLIHVVEVPRSWRAPHAVGEPTGFRFPKRTNQGNAYMDYVEVQRMFRDYFEKTVKLGLLKAELLALAADVRAFKDAGDGLRVSRSEFRPGPFDLHVLESALADTYSITHELPGFVELTTKIRAAARRINAKVEFFRLEFLPVIKAAETRGSAELESMAQGRLETTVSGFVSRQYEDAVAITDSVEKACKLLERVQ